MQKLTPADVSWTDQGEPVSRRYGDCYYSALNGLEETNYVFIQGNALEQRWQQFKQPAFVIGETGFGTGLNFIVTLQHWLAKAPATSHLVFVSAELHPLRKEDMQRSARRWPALAPLYDALLTQYPALTPGIHRLTFERVTLLLLFGDASEMFAALRATDLPLLSHRASPKFDAWFLDGFAPAKNPQLWQDVLFQQLACLSQPGTTLATFSAAGDMRRALERAGFQVSKQPGYGNKREMVVAQFVQPGSITSQAKPLDTIPWHIPVRKASAISRTVTVIGAGIAGCNTAHAFAHAGYQVTLLEQEMEVAAGASGNLQAVLYNKLSAQDDAFAQFNFASFQYALSFYRQLLLRHPSLPIHFCGVLQLALDAKEQRFQQGLFQLAGHYPDLLRVVSQQEASELAGIAVNSGGLFFPGAGWMSPRTVCQALLEHRNIDVKFNHTITTMSHDGTAWSLFQQDACGHRDAIVIIANGHHCQQFETTHWLPIKLLRGQVTHVAPTASSRQLKTVISGKGYVSPATAHWQTFGATYNAPRADFSLLQEDHAENWQHLAENSAALAANWQRDELNAGRCHLRTATPDYLPLCGPVPVRDQFFQQYAALRHHANAIIPEAGDYYPGLYLVGGLGSRGMTWAPLCAALLVHQVSGWPLPLPASLAKALNPARFLIRHLTKNRQ